MLTKYDMRERYFKRRLKSVTKLNLLNEIITDKKIFTISISKIISAAILNCTKFIMLVYLFDRILTCISNSNKYIDFVFIILMNVLCVVSRIITQNIETYYLNDALKLSLEKNFLEKLFNCFRMTDLNEYEQNKSDNEFLQCIVFLTLLLNKPNIKPPTAFDVNDIFLH